jgi:hypothetical protein
MEIVSLNSSNYIGLSSNYKFDETFKLSQATYFTEQGINMPFAEVFASAPDVATNNYSNLYLSKYNTLYSAATIENLESLANEKFSTYLATNAYDGITDNSNFLVIQEVPYSVNTAQLSMSGSAANIANNYFFDVILVTDTLCKIAHTNDNVTRYLTIDVLNNLYFSVDTNTDYLGDQSPQLFYYLYDRANDLIVLSKNISDVAKYVVYTDPQTLTFTNPLTGIALPYAPTSVFRCIPRSESSNDTKLYDPWVSYEKDFHTNSQNINIDRSYENINSNTQIIKSSFGSRG